MNNPKVKLRKQFHLKQHQKELDKWGAHVCICMCVFGSQTHMKICQICDFNKIVEEFEKNDKENKKRARDLEIYSIKEVKDLYTKNYKASWK